MQADLRAAKDTVNSLKYQMSKQSTGKTAVLTNVLDIKSVQKVHLIYVPINLKDTADSHEVRGMNYLIRRYLVEHGFKLTAIQFDQEVFSFYLCM